ncbi:carbohydrate ABC transporter permease [Streptomyces rubiginosohelvolus]|uniref:carbohydrate ABC transporter permease n=1 Tax=Streptomyces rubiginosohelvolus TaxID=67362 RepID=UPI0036C0757E
MSEPFFADSLLRVALFALVQIPLALALALLLDSTVARLKRFFRLVYFVPYGIPGVVAALMWAFLYDPRLSPVVDLLRSVNVDVDLLGPDAILWSIGNVVTWTYTGYNMLIMYAALQAVPADLGEAARVDGAGPWTIALHIKVPVIRPAIVLTGVFSLIGTFQLFTEPQVFRAVAERAALDRGDVHLQSFGDLGDALGVERGDLLGAPGDAERQRHQRAVAQPGQFGQLLGTAPTANGGLRPGGSCGVHRLQVRGGGRDRLAAAAHDPRRVEFHRLEGFPGRLRRLLRGLGAVPTGGDRDPGDAAVDDAGRGLLHLVQPDHEGDQGPLGDRGQRQHVAGLPGASGGTLPRAPSRGRRRCGSYTTLNAGEFCRRQ